MSDKYTYIISVDFDDTLSLGAKWPDIGKPHKRLFSYLINCRKSGIKVILNTMREGETLDAAVEWCKEQGLEFDAVNDNLPEMVELFGCNPRKIFSNYIIDNNVSNIRGFGKKLPDLNKFDKWKGNIKDD